ncbi:hypothetical protein [Klebsiella quasipneumoniae]|uniref:Ead/Ea22-like family protein n=1 Tax=Klebsiella quasipneumoniae subsp. quasipneumoniae TaxID=1667327 RepID=A0AAW8XMK5_9ENTR|nr:hypothetical protein [Klebsiella quasipneumoniae]MBM5555030.1 hypothetical protein [Klebsiella quasipneumoniae]MBM5560412.1 hypothetical protein [Klebsiella quasipneumoniae]MDV0840913.1 hypothetical protein [Klebsiella quasipneumoniae subsp. quasipneumoniae]MDZ0790573.1 hypothetical protein [Klebsiella quasipneumoniae]
MTITLQAVNELIASLESAGELSIKETKVMALAKAFKQLAAENVAIRETIEAVRGVADNSSGIAGWHLNGEIAQWSEILPEIDDIETPATDRIVAEAEARGVEKFAAHLRTNDNGKSVCKMIALGADDFAKQLREGAK